LDKRSLSEQDICTQFITPAIQRAGWNLAMQVRQEVTFTAGRIVVRGKLVARGRRKRADYVLYYTPNLPLAVIEAKDNTHGIGAGMQQALGYAETLDVPFVFSSNGDSFLFHDRTGMSPTRETQLALDAFPSPETLWTQYRAWKGIGATEASVITQPYYVDSSGKAPRYYQHIAINRAVEAIVRGQNRILLVMATGTGKTYTAFQIIWRLWRAGLKKRILFLADRNILVNQAVTNDFKPFGSAMTKVQHRTVDKAFEVYMALYQAVSGTDDEQNIYRQFSPEFFDLVVVDECHRGSAREDSAWRSILEYYASATQIGMTATPKETRTVSNIDYFGEPIYTYSLKQGIEDGFLAPYKVIRVDIDKDLTGWRPPKGAVDDLGQEIEDRIYNQRDFDRILILNQRTKLVAQKVVQLLEATDPYAKTIIFCEDIDHAQRMRTAIVNANPQRVAENSKYVMQITGDNPEGRAELDNFITPDEPYPVIATTSRLLNTGVDAKTCRFIVLDQRIESMTTFKQIIGRGTRIHEETGKLYFNIVDFKKATELFADPDFDGEPVQIYEPQDTDDMVPPDDVMDDAEVMEALEGDPDIEEIIVKPALDRDTLEFDFDTGDVREPRHRYVVGDVPVFIVAERVQYYGPDGKLMTESLKDFTRRALRQQYASLDQFLRRWNTAERKQAIIDELVEQGVVLEALEEQAGRDIDAFDLICHVAFDQPPLTRKERANNVRKRDVFTKYGEQARAVLDALLDKYADEGVGPIERIDVLNVQPLNTLGTPVELVRHFGGRAQYLQAVQELETELYRPMQEDVA
jgi:type I restriction enzyme R subunit